MLWHSKMESELLLTTETRLSLSKLIFICMSYDNSSIFTISLHINTHTFRSYLVYNKNLPFLLFVNVKQNLSHLLHHQKLSVANQHKTSFSDISMVIYTNNSEDQFTSQL